MDKGAVISPCRRWRYALWQYWSVDGKILWWSVWIRLPQTNHWMTRRSENASVMQDAGGSVVSLCSVYLRFDPLIPKT